MQRGVAVEVGWASEGQLDDLGLGQGPPAAVSRSYSSRSPLVEEQRRTGATGHSRRRQYPVVEIGVGEIAQLLRLDRHDTGHHHYRFIGRRLHHFAWRQQRPRRLLTRHHQVPPPGCKPVASVDALGAQLRGRPMFRKCVCPCVCRWWRRASTHAQPLAFTSVVMLANLFWPAVPAARHRSDRRLCRLP